jgi:aspartyl-tRNA synthetase
MQNNMMLRYKRDDGNAQVPRRQRLHRHRNSDADKSTPEGARDYLVPSRVQRRQLLRAAAKSRSCSSSCSWWPAYDRYYQITKCFRDEDLRADRQPEFTQIDIETSFLGEEEIREMFEGMISNMFNAVLAPTWGVPVMTYGDAMQVRLGQARPAREAGVHRTHRTHEATWNSRCSPTPPP